jgi:3-deoxy-manno-octulosonate cytidylyltransferase (CMP-KDO synthetase)
LLGRKLVESFCPLDDLPPLLLGQQWQLRMISLKLIGPHYSAASRSRKPTRIAPLEFSPRNPRHAALPIPKLRPVSKAVVAVLPARWGSTRFPGKALHPIAGRPLIQHVWERCCRAKQLSGVIVATDDMRIAEAAFAFGADVAMTSRRHKSGTDRVAEVARNLRGVSHVINVQGDEPMISPRLIDDLAATLLTEPKLEMITAANRFSPGEDIGNPNAVKVVMDKESNALYFSRAPIPHPRDGKSLVPHYRHQGIYGYSLRLLLKFVKWKPTRLEQTEQLEQLRALEHGVRIRVAVTSRVSTGVDRPEDVALVERMLSQ